MYALANRSTLAATLAAVLFAVPALAQQGQGRGRGQGGGKGLLIKAVTALNKLNATKGYELTPAQAKTLLPILRKLAVAKAMYRTDAGKCNDSIRKALTTTQLKKLEALADTCSTPGQPRGAKRQRGGFGGPINPFYVEAGKKPEKGSGAEALRSLITALQRKAK